MNLPKGISKRRMTISAIKEYDDMCKIHKTMQEELHGEYEGIAAPKVQDFSRMPSAHNPMAGQDRLAVQVDRLTLIKERYQSVKEYMVWFDPAWQILSSEEQTVLRGFYMRFNQRDGARGRLAKELCFSESSVDRIHKQALQRLESLLFGWDNA